MEAAAKDHADGGYWGPIIRAHQHRVLMSIVGMGIPFARAQEVAQATWARLIEQRRAGQLKEAKYPGLALAQARYLALEEHRKLRRETKTVESLHVSKTISDLAVVDPEGLIQTKEQLARAPEIIKSSAPSAQRVFLMVYQDPGRPHAEIAEQVGLSVQRVRQILCEVRRELRRAMERER